MSAYPSPEIVPAMDEQRPQIAPNLASNMTLCAAVAQHIYRDYFYPYLLQQQRMWATWDRIDDAWRVRGKRSDLDISATDRKFASVNPDGKGDGIVDQND